MQQRSSDNRVFLGLIGKVNKGTENEVFGGPSDVENLRRPDLPSEIWEVLEAYSDVFPSELPRGVPPVRMRHQFKISLNNKIPPSIGNSTKSVHSSSLKPKAKSKKC